MTSRIDQCLNGLSRPRHYSGEQWFALLLSLVCLCADGWAIVLTIGEANRPSSRLHGLASRMGLTILTLEGLLGLAALSLLLFAFSTPPSPSRS